MAHRFGEVLWPRAQIQACTCCVVPIGLPWERLAAAQLRAAGTHSTTTTAVTTAVVCPAPTQRDPGPPSQLWR